MYSLDLHFERFEGFERFERSLLNALNVLNAREFQPLELSYINVWI